MSDCFVSEQDLGFFGIVLFWFFNEVCAPALMRVMYRELVRDF